MRATAQPCQVLAQGHRSNESAQHAQQQLCSADQHGTHDALAHAVGQHVWG